MRFATLAALTLLATAVATAQTPDSATRRAGARVSGVVHDSVARTPLAGAIVQLVAVENQPRSGRTAVSDSIGRFTLSDVPDGRYMIGFLHAMLDSLGLEPTVREVEVVGTQPVRVDLGIPSAARLRDAICGPRSPSNSGAVIAGVVRDIRDGAPATGVEVMVEWIELSFRSDGLVDRHPRITVTTEENGWFALCNVPSPGTVAISASKGADTTDVIDVQVSVAEYLRRELYLGPARTRAIADSARGALAPPLRHVRTGDGHVTGTVETPDGRPLAGAQVSMPNGPQTRTNERGQWTLVNAPLGTRLLEVRAISYYPERRAVDVGAGAPPVRVVLSTLKAVLDTVRVTAARLGDHRSGFEDRRRNSGLGRFMTREDVARRAVANTSELFRMFPGFSVETGILMRSAFGLCPPALFLDGKYFLTPSELEIDTWVRPKEIAGIEVYYDQVPPQFQHGMNGCGSIVIWTKR